MVKLSLVLKSYLNDLSIEVTHLKSEDPYRLELIHYRLELIQEKIKVLKMLSSKVEGEISDEELDEMWDKAIN